MHKLDILADIKATARKCSISGVVYAGTRSKPHSAAPTCGSGYISFLHTLASLIIP